MPLKCDGGFDLSGGDCRSLFFRLEEVQGEGSQPMKVLILGAGGREHALAWAVARSPRVKEVVCAPGNGGMAQVARCVAGGFEEPGRHGAAGARPRRRI